MSYPADYRVRTVEEKEKIGGAYSTSQFYGWTTDPLGVCFQRDAGESFKLFAGYEKTRVFEVDTNMGVFQCIGHIDNDGDLVDSMGDDFGYSFYDVSRWMLFPPNKVTSD